MNTSLALKQTGFAQKFGAKFLQKHNTKVTTGIVAAVSLVMFAGIAGASSDTTFSNWIDWIVEKIEGSGGLLLVMLGLVGALWGLLQGNLKLLGPMILLVLFATLGPTVLKGMFTFAF